MQKLDQETLLAYVDGELSPDRAREVEAALAEDADAQAMVRRLRQAPVGSLQEAFDAGLAGSREEDLTERVMRYEIHKPSHRSVRPLVAMAASVAFLCVGVGIGFLVGEGYFERQTVGSATTPAWIVQMAQYQKLYGRDTVILHEPSEAEVRQTETWLGEQLGVDLKVPVLEQFGLAFKRGQVLFAGDRPIAQLVYLPEKGDPVAFCVSAASGTDQEPSAAEVEGLNLVSWREAGYGYVLMGKLNLALLRDVASSLVSAPAIRPGRPPTIR